MLKVEMPRAIYNQGRATLLYYIVSLLIIGFVFIVLVVLLLSKVVLSPLSQLSRQVSEIGASGNLAPRRLVEFPAFAGMTE